MARAPITWRNVNSQLRSDPLEAFNQAADSVRESIGGIQSGIQGIADREAAERGRTLESLFRERITGLDALDANASVLRDQNALRELAGGRVSGFNGNEFLNTIRSEIENPINKNLSVLQAKASSPTATAADVDAFQSAIAQNQRLSNIAEFTQSGLDASNALTNRDDVAFAANYGFDPATANSYQEAEKQFLEYLSGRESIDANERQQFLNQFADRFDRAFKISDENKVNIAAEFQVAENSLNQGLKAEQRSLANKQAQLTLPKSVQLTNKSGQNVGNLLEDMEKVSDIVGNWDANDLNNIRGRMSREFGSNIPQARIDQVVASMVEFGYFGNNLKGDADKLSREILQNDLDNNRAILKDIDGIYDNISRYERGLVQLPGLTGSARKLVRQDGFTAESIQNLITNGLGLNDLYKPAFSNAGDTTTDTQGGTDTDINTDTKNSTNNDKKEVTEKVKEQPSIETSDLPPATTVRERYGDMLAGDDPELRRLNRMNPIEYLDDRFANALSERPNDPLLNAINGIAGIPSLAVDAFNAGSGLIDEYITTPISEIPEALKNYSVENVRKSIQKGNARREQERLRQLEKAVETELPTTEDAETPQQKQERLRQEEQDERTFISEYKVAPATIIEALNSPSKIKDLPENLKFAVGVVQRELKLLKKNPNDLPVGKLYDLLKFKDPNLRS